MISYDELVTALTTWRAEQGLAPMLDNTTSYPSPHAAPFDSDAPLAHDVDGVDVVNTDDIATPDDDIYNSAHASESVMTPNMEAADYQVDEAVESDQEPLENASNDSMDELNSQVDEQEVHLQEDAHPMFTEDEGATKIVDDPVAFDSGSVADDDDDYYDAIASEEVDAPSPVEVEAEDHSVDGLEAAADDAPFSPFEDTPPLDEASMDVMTSAQGDSEDVPASDDYSDDEGESTRVGGLDGYDIEDELE